MTAQVGGLFESQEVANRAYQALQSSGFSNQDIHMLIQRPRNKTVRATNVKIQDIAISAVVGGLILGALGAFLGFLVGSGRLPLPGFGPGAVDITGEFLISSVMAGLILGGLTGVILGVVAKLLRSQEKAEVVTRKIKQGGVLVTVSANDSHREAKARRVMEESEAVEVGDPAKNWDLNTWISPNENNPRLGDTE